MDPLPEATPPRRLLKKAVRRRRRDAAPIIRQSPGPTRFARLPRRLLQLGVGLAMFGVSLGMMIRSTLGLNPWDVFHYGIAERVPLSFGMVTIVVSIGVLLLWIPLRQRPGPGTVANAILVGLATDATLSLLTEPEGLPARIALLGGGVILNGLATALYIGARLGPGPRDGLMTGLVSRTGLSVRVIRTSIEAAVLVVGFLMGGVVGLGTVLYALAIGPLVHVFLPRCEVPLGSGGLAGPATAET